MAGERYKHMQEELHRKSLNDKLDQILANQVLIMSNLGIEIGEISVALHASDIVGLPQGGDGVIDGEEIEDSEIVGDDEAGDEKKAARKPRSRNRS